MQQTKHYDAAVIGSGPNGLAGAIRLAQAGHSVIVYEAQQQIGGGAQTAELTLPGFRHDVCSSVHPLGVCSPFFNTLPLRKYGLEWISPPLALAHPLDDGTAAVLGTMQETCDSIGWADAAAYRSLMSPLVENWFVLRRDVLAPPRLPAGPVTLARFGWNAWRGARGVAEQHFRDAHAQALLAGIAAHSGLPLEQGPSAAFALLLGAAGHATGWPFARGGSQNLSNALADHFRSLGGEIRTGERIESLDQLPKTKITLCDVSPRQLLALAGSRFDARYKRALQRFIYGPAAYKMDWALDGPIPWTARACAFAGTVHLGGTLKEIARSEWAVWRGGTEPSPFVILSQPVPFDPSRAPEGKYIAWAYCHVPNRSPANMADAIENQIERFAPGFRDRILARNIMHPAALENHNPNLIGGCIVGGLQTYRQAILRPTYRLYSTPAKGVYLCSASTPPGGGVHGMCGFYAAERAIKKEESGS